MSRWVDGLREEEMIRLDEVTSEQSLIFVFTECGYSLNEALEKLKEIEERNRRAYTHYVPVPSGYFELLEAYMDKEGIKVKELARRLGIKYGTVWNFMKRRPKKLIAENVVKIEKLLEREGLIDKEGRACSK